jgi:O-antigen/teichoic acid export membrane protein
MNESTTPPGEVPQEDILHSGDAGGKVVRGGVIRTAGFVGGVLLGLGTSVVLLRYLGVADYGRYGTVAALLGMVLALSDGGLTAIGARELAVLRVGVERTRMASTLMFIRAIASTIGVLVAVAFAAVAYSEQLTIGAALVGFSVIMISMQAMATVPLLVSLRVVPVTVFELLRGALTLAGVIVLVGAGTGLNAFFALQIPIAGILLVMTLVYVRRTTPISVSLDRSDALRLARETLPLALASVMIVLYGGAMVIIVSLLTSDYDTGLFVTSSRVMEVLIGLPGLVIAVALPVMSVASLGARTRLRPAIQLMTEVGIVVSTLIAVTLALAADAVVQLIGGAAFAAAGPILKVQAAAIIGVFFTQLLFNTLVSLRKQRLLIMTSSIGFVTVVILGIVLVTAFGPIGGAYAVVAAEAVLGVALVFVLRFAAPDIVPSFRFVWKVAAAAAVALSIALLPLSSEWLAAIFGGIAFIAVAGALRAIPGEIAVALGTPIFGESRMRAAVRKYYGGS